MKTFACQNCGRASSGYLKGRKEIKYCSLTCYWPNSPTTYKLGHKGMSLDKNPSWKGG